MSQPERKIIVIPAKPQAAVQEAQRSLRVAAYCRVSTEEEEQQSSYEAQCSYYTEKIMTTPGWTMVDIYADATDIIGLKQNPTNGRRFSPIFFVYRAFST